MSQLDMDHWERPSRPLAALSVVLLFLALAGGVAAAGQSRAAPPAQTPAPQQAGYAPAPAPAAPLPPPAGLSAGPAPSAAPAGPGEPAPLPLASASAAPYDYAAPVPQTQPVDVDWFDDAAFLGDSRTEGLLLYTDLSPAGRLAYRGLNVQTVRTKRFVPQDGGTVTALDCLQSVSYGKIYLMLGVNELSWMTPPDYRQRYGELLDLILAAQPQAQIYLQTIIPVTAAKSAQGEFTNERILAFNQEIRGLATEKQVYLVDVWSAFVDEDGCLPQEESSDGVHLYQRHYQRWLDYLAVHTVSPAAPS